MTDVEFLLGGEIRVAVGSAWARISIEECPDLVRSYLYSMSRFCFDLFRVNVFRTRSMLFPPNRPRSGSGQVTAVYSRVLSWAAKYL